MHQDHAPARDAHPWRQALACRHRRVPLPGREPLRPAPALEQRECAIEPDLRRRLARHRLRMRRVRCVERPFGGQRLAEIGPGRRVPGARQGCRPEAGDRARHVAQLRKRRADAEIAGPQRMRGPQSHGCIVASPVTAQQVHQVVHRMPRACARTALELPGSFLHSPSAAEAERIEQPRLGACSRQRPGKPSRFGEPAGLQRHQRAPQHPVPLHHFTTPT